ncbi:peripheral myelin protein 22-like [Podarcis raffonei]|uniref:peripheral myelin protein 22-like n=1 Tax=Podarcis raffonei TaxID=65483 RepID=UPI0023292BEA|nr:peripheral myelin protein 22-like [Podarcis raffonei]
MQALQIGAMICSFISLLLFLIALGSDHWVADSNRTIGLWKFCVYYGVNSGCRSLGTDVNNFVHSTRVFMLLGMTAGAISCLGLCGKYFDFQFGFISRAKTSAIASILAAVCVLIAMASYTEHVGSLASYGWSFGLGWASFPLFLITGGLAFRLNAVQGIRFDGVSKAQKLQTFLVCLYN